MPVRTVAIIVHDGVQGLDVAGPVDVFTEANNFLPPDERYETLLVAEHCRPIRTSSRIQIMADRSFEDARDEFAMVLVAGGPALPFSGEDAVLSEWLVAAAARAGLYGSICTGAFSFGHAGLLDGRTATTHWQNAPGLTAMFPKANVERDRIYVRDGRLVTSAGVTAGIDLALALVADTHGPQISLSVAKRLVVVAQRQGGQSQFSPFLNVSANDVSPLGKVQRYVMEHISENHTVGRLAEVAGMSVRNLNRVFSSELRISPREFVESARLDVARNLLEGGDLPLKVVAFDCGFGSAERMRATFAKRLGISPMQYREQFQRR